MKNPEPNRIPRPLGLTALSINYQKTGTEEDKQRVYSYIITSYLQQGFTFNGNSYSIYDMAYKFKIPVQEIQAQLRKSAKNINGLLDPTDLVTSLESMAYLSASWAIEDRGRALNQFNLINEAQDGKYKAFVSSEAGKSLKLLMEANKGVADTFAAFFKANGNSAKNQILIQTGDGPNTQLKENNQSDTLTTIKALELLEHSSNLSISIPLREDKTQQEDLFKEYGIESTPSCSPVAAVPRPQGSGQVDNERVTAPQLYGEKAIPLPIPSIEAQPEGPKAKIKRVKKAHNHDNRRATSLNIDTENSVG